MKALHFKRIKCLLVTSVRGLIARLSNWSFYAVKHPCLFESRKQDCFLITQNGVLSNQHVNMWNRVETEYSYGILVFQHNLLHSSIWALE